MAETSVQDLTIRRATADDAPLLLTLNQEVQALHAAEPAVYKPLVTETAPFAAMLGAADAYTFIAEVAGVPVGYCYAKLAQHTESPFHYASSALHIDQLAVREEYRQRGIGTALLERAKALAVDLGADRLVLGVRAFNTRARRLYLRQGFVVTERMEATVGG